MRIYHKNAGFTLIELLVVIAIIGLLASIALVALNSARIKSRAAKRMGDIRNLNTAINLFYETNGRYPLSTNSNKAATSFDPSVFRIRADSSDWLVGAATFVVPWATLGADMTSVVATMPKDPINVEDKTYTYELFVNAAGEPVNLYVHKVNASSCNITTAPGSPGTQITGYIYSQDIESSQTNVPYDLECLINETGFMQYFTK